MAKKQEYGNESITSLKGADRVRKRPAVIFGSDGVEGCAHSIFEIVSNSIDEARDGHGDTINVTRCKDGSVIVEDFGRGMPVDWNNGEGRYNWELLFCEMYAGGKYGEGEDNYEFSLGLNGLGLCATQYASAWMTADIYRDGFHYHLDFQKGENVGGLQKEPYKGRRTGSIIHWKPDDEVFTDIDVPGSYYKDVLRRQAARVQHFFHQLLIAQRQCFVAGGRLCTKIHKALAKAVVQLAEQLFPGHAGQVHFIHEYKGRHMVAPQQPPQRFGMALHAVRSADHQHGVIQHLQGALSLGGKIHMAGGIQQSNGSIARRKQRLLGKDSDAACFFQAVGIQKGVSVIHPPQLPDLAGTVQQSFGKRRLSGIHMGSNAHYQSFHNRRGTGTRLFTSLVVMLFLL